MSDIRPTESQHPEDQTELELTLRKILNWFSANATTVIYALAAILAIIALVVFFKRQPSGDPMVSQALLPGLSARMKPEEFQQIADKSPNSTIGQWARLRQAESLMEIAVTNLFSDRKLGMEDVESAKAAYNMLASGNIQEDLRQRVLIGLARVAECECDGSEDSIKAVESAWNQLLGAFPDSVAKDHAESRIARLARPQTAEFYAWFAKLEPQPSNPGGNGVPEIPDGLLPNDFQQGMSMDPAGSLKESADDSNETTTEGTDTTDSEDAATEDAATDPAKAESTKLEMKENAAEEKQAEEKQAEEKQAEEKSAEEKSAEEKPAEEKPAEERQAEEKVTKDAKEAATKTEEAKKTEKSDGDN